MIDIFLPELTDSMICAGLPYGGRDHCLGDAGGPLTTYLNGNIVLCGIASWGIGCGSPDYPGIYTKVPHILGWINYVVSPYV